MTKKRNGEEKGKHTIKNERKKKKKKNANYYTTNNGGTNKM